VLTHTSFDPGALVRLLISVGDRVVRAEARVVYENDRPDGRRETGLEFLRLTDSDRTLLANLLDADRQGRA
jgi:hypothetical protein